MTPSDAGRYVCSLETFPKKSIFLLLQVNGEMIIMVIIVIMTMDPIFKKGQKWKRVNKILESLIDRNLYKKKFSFVGKTISIVGVVCFPGAGQIKWRKS